MMPRWIYRGGAGLVYLFAADLASAQGSLTPMNTGGGQPLISEVRSVFVDTDATLQRLVFDWGFATDETVSPGVFPDSFTVTIQSTNGSLTGVYVVADTSGTVLAPMTPGAVIIEPGNITMTGIPYPSLLPSRAYQRAFNVNAYVPAVFGGSHVNVYFDLFDNQNGIRSQAWFNNVSIVPVPEPGAISLTIFAGLVLCLFRRLHS